LSTIPNANALASTVVGGLGGGFVFRPKVRRSVHEALSSSVYTARGEQAK
jgi:hypothetical protein